MSMAVPHAFNQLAHKLLNHICAQTQTLQRTTRAFGKRFTPTALAYRKRLHILLQVQVKIFEYEVQFVAIGMHNVEETHDVWVIHFFQERDFSNGRAGDAFVFGFETDLLECNNAVVFGREIFSFIHNTVRPYCGTQILINGVKASQCGLDVHGGLALQNDILTLSNLFHLLVILHGFCRGYFRFQIILQW